MAFLTDRVFPVKFSDNRARTLPVNNVRAIYNVLSSYDRLSNRLIGIEFKTG